MILSPQQNDKFYIIFDTLTAYANKRLGVTDKMLIGDPEMIDSFEQSRVAVELWKNKAVIDEFLELPDTMLRRDELEVARSWKSALIGTFLVLNLPDGHSYFIIDGYAFDVYGITREIAEIIPNAPTYVHAALLPFEDKIIYGGYLIEEPTPPMNGSSFMSIVEDLDRLKSSGHAISTGVDFLEVYPLLEEMRVQREVDNMMRDLGSLGEDVGIQGTHRGVIAGLAGQERKDASIKAARTDLGNWLDMRAFLDSQCSGSSSDVSLHDLVAATGVETLRRDAAQIGVRGIRSLSRGGLVDALCEAYLQNVDYLEQALCLSQQGSVKLAEDAFNAGGKLEFTCEELLAQEHLAVPLAPYLNLFKQAKDSYAYVIPAELMEVYAQVDWGHVNDRRGFRAAVVKLFEGLAELRGVVELRDALEQFGTLYPEYAQYSDEDVLEVVHVCAGMSGYCYDLLKSEVKTYVLHRDLAIDYYDACARARVARPMFAGNRCLHGPLTDVIYDILQNRRFKPRRKLTREMLGEDGVHGWELALAPVRALHDFLDANVPDGQNDYFFADEVTFELVNMAHGGFAMQDCVEFINSQGFHVDEPHVEELASLMMHMVNNVPIWGNNGWSFNDLAEANTGFKVFYNEDGTPMNLSGDDDCPCGSGKKYGDCHGKIGPGMLDLGSFGLSPFDL